MKFLNTIFFVTESIPFSLSTLAVPSNIEEEVYDLIFITLFL